MREHVYDFCDFTTFGESTSCWRNVIFPLVPPVALLGWYLLIHNVHTFAFWTQLGNKVHLGWQVFAGWAKGSVSKIKSQGEAQEDDETVMPLRPPSEIQPDHAVIINGDEIATSAFGTCAICVNNLRCPIKYFSLLRSVQSSLGIFLLWSLILLGFILVWRIVVEAFPFELRYTAIGEFTDFVLDSAPRWPYIVVYLGSFLVAVLAQILVSNQINQIPPGRYSYGQLNRFCLILGGLLGVYLVVFALDVILDATCAGPIEKANVFNVTFWNVVNIGLFGLAAYAEYVLLQTSFKCKNALAQLRQKQSGLQLSSESKNQHIDDMGAEFHRFLATPQTQVVGNQDSSPHPVFSDRKSSANFNKSADKDLLLAHDKAQLASPKCQRDTSGASNRLEISQKLNQGSPICGCACCFPAAQGKLTVKHVKHPNPYGKKWAYYDVISFSYLTPLIYKAYRRVISQGDLVELPAELHAEKHIERFRNMWSAEVNAKKDKASLLKVTFSFIKYRLLVGALLKLIQDLCTLSQPLLLRSLISSLTEIHGGLFPTGEELSQTTIKLNDSIFSALQVILTILVVNISQVVTLNAYFQWQLNIGLRLKLVLGNFVHYKALKYAFGSDANASVSSSPSSKENAKPTEKAPKASKKKGGGDKPPVEKTSRSGEITNLMSVDADRVVELMPFIQILWSAPFQVIVTLVILWFQLGSAMFAGLVVMAIGFIISTVAAVQMRILHQRVSKLRDQRVEITGEVLAGFKIVKTYSWEEPFQEKIKAMRVAELGSVWKTEICSAIQRSVMVSLILLVTVASLTAYLLMGQTLTAEAIYPAISAFMLLRFPLGMLPMVITTSVHAYVSNGRLQRFFMGDEIPPPRSLPSRPMTDPSVPTVEARHLTLSWPNGTPLLNDVTFTCSPGTLTLLIGETGVGKSGLLQALIGEIYPEPKTFDKQHNSSLFLRGRIAYCAQTAWIQSQTVRENILFGRPYNEEWYRQVVVACALEDDFKIFAQADQTEIGERGVTLSGGQKQRISLARAAYQCGDISNTSETREEFLPADIIILDDILSSVDVHVAEHILEQCIFNMFCRLNRTVILATHKLDFLPRAHQIIFLQKVTITRELSDGPSSESPRSINDNGTAPKSLSHDSDTQHTAKSLDSSNEVTIDIDMSELRPQKIIVATAPVIGHHTDLLHLPAFQKYVEIITSLAVQTESETPKPMVSAMSPIDELLSPEEVDDQPLNSQNDDLNTAYVSRRSQEISPLQGPNSEAPELVPSPSKAGFGAQPSCATTTLSKRGSRELSQAQGSFVSRANYSKSKVSLSSDEKLSHAGRPHQALISPELMEVGKISWKVYYKYIEGMGGFLVLALIAFAYIGSSGLSLGYNRWLSYWLDNYDDMDPLKQGLAVYAGLGLLQTAFVVISGLSFYNAGLKSSKHLHDRLLGRILRAPLSFMEQTLIGTLLSRFSKDIFFIDTLLPQVISMFLVCMLNVVEVVVALIMTIPMFLLFGCIIFFIYGIIQAHFLPARRQIQRLCSVARSPLYTHFTEVLDGYSTIRAYNAQSRFHTDYTRKQNVEVEATFNDNTLSRWLSIRLECLGGLLVFCVGIFVFYGVMQRTLSPALGGFCMTYALNVTGTLAWAVRMAGDVQSRIVSVERVEQYASSTPVEKPLRLKNKQLSATWPSKGEICYKNLFLRYRPDLPCALKSLNFTIPPSTKVGVVGRTGAGKSSIFVSLLRLVEPCEGTILIDEQNIHQMGLFDLRSRLGIIPQDPLLFSGSLRFNVDPFNAYSDDEIWQAFERVHLADYIIQELNSNLEHPIQERGANISAGQRQLVCFARALLKRPKILLLDEATASIDPKTDQLIQQTLRKEFKNCTIVTIAHRLATIMDYDLIMVLDRGKVAEMGPVAELIKKENGIFRQMCESAHLIDTV